MVQPFLTAPSLDAFAKVSIVSFAVAIAIRARSSSRSTGSDVSSSTAEGA
jgi:hypothetical protein